MCTWTMRFRNLVWEMGTAHPLQISKTLQVFQTKLRSSLGILIKENNIRARQIYLDR